MADVHRLPLDMAVLKAIVSSFKMREEKDAEGEKRMLRKKQLKTLSPEGPELHHNARREDHPQYKGKRIAVSDEQVPWRFDWATYNPKEFTTKFVLTEGVAKGWADPPTPQEVPDLMQRETYEGPISFDAAGRPLNPRGRTGVRGRGLLGKWGPNHAADPIVTRHHPQTGRLQVVAVRREDTGQFAVPGGMSESPGEKWNPKVWSALQTEDLRQVDDSPLQQEHTKALLTDLFQGEEATVVYRGCEHRYLNLGPSESPS